MDEALLKQLDKASEDYGIEIYSARRGVLSRKQWRARIVSEDNDFRLFISSEGYNNRKELRTLCERVMPHLPISFVEG